MSTHDNGADMRTFTNFAVYKDTCALSLKVIPPSLTIRNSAIPSRSVSRSGTMLFEFAPIGGTGQSTYDWHNKENFALSAVECAEIVRMSDLDGADFVHRPSNNLSGILAICSPLRFVY